MKSKILIIAGFDPSGNAGIVRDLEIVYSFSLHASCVVTALTAQNSKKFLKPQVVSSSIFKNQLRAIEPLSQYQAIKIGMLGNGEIVKALVSFLGRQKKIPPIILDPVMESSTGGLLLNHPGRKLLWDTLLPLVSLWTPNLGEASYYGSSRGVLKYAPTQASMEKTAKFLWSQKKIPILIKGGHLKGKKVQDLYVDSHQKAWFIFPRQEARSRKQENLASGFLPPASQSAFRGTGCALSTLIACFVAVGFPLFETVREARKVMQEWLKNKI